METRLVYNVREHLYNHTLWRFRSTPRTIVTERIKVLKCTVHCAALQIKRHHRTGKLHELADGRGKAIGVSSARNESDHLHSRMRAAKQLVSALRETGATTCT